MHFVDHAVCFQGRQISGDNEKDNNYLHPAKLFDGVRCNVKCK